MHVQKVQLAKLGCHTPAIERSTEVPRCNHGEVALHLVEGLVDNQILLESIVTVTEHLLEALP